MKKENITETVNETVKETSETGLAVRQQQAVQTNDYVPAFDLVKAQLDAELEKNLRQLSVTEFISPSAVLDSANPGASSAVFDLLDCFEFEIVDDGEVKEIAMYVCDFGGEVGVKMIAQSMSTQRERWLNTFKSARVAKIQLTLTQVRFRRLEKGGKAGNKPIVIELTRESTPIKTQM
jgi:hypothetical protein